MRKRNTLSSPDTLPVVSVLALTEAESSAELALLLLPAAVVEARSTGMRSLPRAFCISRSSMRTQNPRSPPDPAAGALRWPPARLAKWRRKSPRSPACIDHRYSSSIAVLRESTSSIWWSCRMNT